MALFFCFTDDAECELNCRPVNQKYFARLREYAVDGTRCEKIQNQPKNNITYEHGVCVEGKCKVRTTFTKDSSVLSLVNKLAVKL